jgi:hypothetical protein
LSLDRVWITADGRAKLLDFTAPATAGLQPNRPAEAESVAPSPLTFLRQVALSALEGRPVNAGDADHGAAKVPLAAHASRFLEALKPGANLGECIAQLRSLLGVPAEIPRARRLALVVGVLAVPVLFTLPMHVLIVCYGLTVVFVVLPCLVASLLFQGGALVKLQGIVFVNRDGARSSRWRVAWRNLVAWLPFLLLPAGVKLLTPVLGVNGSMVAVVGLSAALALTSALLPKRDLPDRVAGTWPVPR